MGNSEQLSCKFCFEVTHPQASICPHRNSSQNQSLTSIAANLLNPLKPIAVATLVISLIATSYQVHQIIHITQQNFESIDDFANYALKK